MVSIFKSLAQIAAAILDLLIDIGKALHFSLLIAVYALIVAPVYIAGLVAYFVSVALADQIKRGASGRNFYPEKEGLKPFEYYLNLGNEDNIKSIVDNDFNTYSVDDSSKKPTIFVIPELTSQEKETVEETGVLPLNMMKEYLLREVRNLALGFGLDYVEIYCSGSSGEKIIISYSCKRDDDGFQRFLDLGIFSDMFYEIFKEARISSIILFDMVNRKPEDISLEQLVEIINERWQRGDFDDDF
ncbi:MAG: hypothetical protein K9J37_11720 [Saprospiraceae bacterium]|nr:hypothetical protein [Saprospiraceae bacterium]MCF8250575.1 hypothetical protein [Saprospiraceae bacterium]MCF8282805.1 hypothetical protein [Bacteroidales bacterium]MCF8313106.1 hypothetical protein [Saprospiraceae bacterium]MCF8441530.1 hypothetical protein [Saprospiraceae bacterium]